jgi:hypothetical protein
VTKESTEENEEVECHENFLVVVVEIRSVMKISIFGQPFEVLQLSSFVKQGATLLQFKPTNLINFIKLTIILRCTGCCMF